MHCWNSNPSGRIGETFHNGRQEMKKRETLDKYVFPLVCISVRHKDPGIYTCLILLPRNYLYLANSSLTSQTLEVILVFINVPYN